jgi:hypothetical protein
MFLKKASFLLLIAFGSIIEVASQVNLQTGSAKINIPLYSYSDPQNRLSTSVSLAYGAGNGLKVNEIASSVGTGWVLNCGGYIQRVQYGEPDDQKNYDNYTYPVFPNSDPQSAFWVWAKNYYANGFLHSEFTSSDAISNRGAYTPMYTFPYYYFKPPQVFSADREQDFFKFSFNGRDGYFLVSRKDGSGISEIRTVYDSKLKIEKIEGDLNNTQNIRTTISKFMITDENGIKYVFEDADLNQVCDYDQGTEYNVATGAFQNFVSNINVSIPETRFRVINAVPQNSFTKNKWNLTEIINPMTGVKIMFQYEMYNVDIKTQKQFQRSVSGSNDRISITHERSISQVKRLKKIILNTNESVDFEYSPDYRIDIPTDKNLSRISIKYANVPKLNWDFTYGYFVKTDIKSPGYNFNLEERTWSRLCLQSLKKSGPSGLSEPPYVFDYYRGNEDNMNSAVPAMFSCQQDLGGYYSTAFFGFYNPTTNTTGTGNPPYEPFGDVLLPKSVYQNILSGLNYNPTLGYGTGTSSVRPTIEARNGIIKTIKYPLGGELKFDFELNDVGSYPYKAFYGVRVKAITEYDGINHSNDKINEYKYIKEDNSSSSWGYENFENKDATIVRVRQDCGPGVRPLLNKLSIAKPFGNFILGQLGIIPVSSTMVTIGGSQVPIFAIIYFANIVYAIFDGFFGSNAPVYNTYNTDIYSNRLINNNTLPFQYSRVEVVNKLGAGDIGKTVHEFTSPASIPSSTSTSSFAIDVQTIAKPYSSKQRYAYWIYGLPEKLTIYDKNIKIIKKIVNTYNPIKSILSATPYLSKKWIPLQYDYGCGFVGEDPNSFDKIISETYSPLTGRIELTNTKEYTYNANNEFTFTESNYEYLSSNYLPTSVKTTNSKGEEIESVTRYITDYGMPGTIQIMKDINNIVNVPISAYSFITKPSGRFMTGGLISEFNAIPNGDFKVIKTHAFRNDIPVPDFLVPITRVQLIPSGGYFIENGTSLYDINGNAVQLSADNGIASTIYDYDNKLPVANIVNANAGDISYTSFEADGIGNWSFNFQNVTSESFVTGRKCFKFPSAGGGISKASLNTNQIYKLSFWCKGGLPSIYKGTPPNHNSTGISLIKSYTNTATGWTYYEYSISNSASLKIDNNLGGLTEFPGVFYLDEIRLYPQNAVISTVTYDPMIGKTSEMDDNGRVIYYEYDDLGRLKLVLDEKRNVLKSYEYNYKQ